jgi:hypothetical protein
MFTLKAPPGLPDWLALCHTRSERGVVAS